MKKKARQQAEIDKRKADEKAEADKKEALLKAEKEKAEQERKKQEEEQKRIENKEHRRKINKEALADLEENGFIGDDAKTIIELIIKGKISNVTINY